jgi:broad specificity phosphatase PhoE
VTAIEIVFETHSLTVDNERGLATGWRGGELSSRGRALARELGERRRDDGVALVIASDLGRAAETARVAFPSGSPPVRLDWQLREVDYGDLTGSRADALDRARHVDVPYPRGESYVDATRRVRGLLDDLAAERPGDRVLLIGHTATRWALDHLLDGRTLEELVTAPFDWRPGWDYVLRPRARARIEA